jgi:23S rRNA pseudouridine2457 synthase
VSTERLQELQTGVRIRISGDDYYITPPCEVAIAEPPDFPSPKTLSPRVQTTWLSLTLTEGKYRQVRKMVAAIRHGCIRLIRTSIEELELGNLKSGEVKELSEDVFFEKLNLDLSQKNRQ